MGSKECRKVEGSFQIDRRFVTPAMKLASPSRKSISRWMPALLIKMLMLGWFSIQNRYSDLRSSSFPTSHCRTTNLGNEFFRLFQLFLAPSADDDGVALGDELFRQLQADACGSSRDDSLVLPVVFMMTKITTDTPSKHVDG